MTNIDKIKTALIALGMTGSAVIGGVAVDLTQPEKIVEVPVAQECLGEEIMLSGVSSCLEKPTYDFLKQTLYDKHKTTSAIEKIHSPGGFYLDVINHEKKKQGVVLHNVTSVEDMLNKYNELLK